MSEEILSTLNSPEVSTSVYCNAAHKQSIKKKLIDMVEPLHLGKKIRCVFWSPNKYLVVVHQSLSVISSLGIDVWKPTLRELAEDWEVVE